MKEVNALRNVEIVESCLFYWKTIVLKRKENGRIRFKQPEKRRSDPGNGKTERKEKEVKAKTKKTSKSIAAYEITLNTVQRRLQTVVQNLNVAIISLA